MTAGAQDRTVPETPRRRGAEEPWHPVVLGSVIGAVGASAFVLVNRDGLPPPWPVVSLAAWVVALAFFVAVVLARRRRLPDPPRPATRAGLVYITSVVGMLVLIAAGRIALVALGREDLQPAVVVLAVGLHFVPFARAFRAPVFGLLGAVVAGLGVVGILGGALVGTTVAPAAAVVTGVVMLVVVSADQLRTRPHRDPPARDRVGP